MSAETPGVVRAVLHPERFFGDASAPVALPRGVRALLMVGLGLAVVQDAVGRVLVNRPHWDRWLVFWGLGLAAAALVGPLRWLFAGGVYRLFLRWSGVRDTRPGDARAMAGISHAIVLLPYAARGFTEALIYDSPVRALEAQDRRFGSVVWLFLFAWSIWVGYQAAVSRYPVRPGRAAFWFLAFPWLLIVVGAVVGFLAASAA